MANTDSLDLTGFLQCFMAMNLDEKWWDSVEAPLPAPGHQMPSLFVKEMWCLDDLAQNSFPERYSG